MVLLMVKKVSKMYLPGQKVLVKLINGWEEGVVIEVLGQQVRVNVNGTIWRMPIGKVKLEK